MRTPRPAGLIATFRTIPLELFRVNKGPLISLREWAALPPQRSTIYDLRTYKGMVLPKALDARNYQLPNGASMRPNGRYQQGLVRRLAGKDWIIYALLKGTPLPKDLIFVHEHTDHYSLQPNNEMTLQDLNQSITRFLQASGTVYNAKQWLATYKYSALSAKKMNGLWPVIDNDNFVG